MRARLKFKLNASEDTLTGRLIDSQESQWWVKRQGDPSLSEEQKVVDGVIKRVEGSIAEKDAAKFSASKRKYAIKHIDSDSEGALSLEDGIWILRLHKDSVPPLQDACGAFVSLVSAYRTAKNENLVDILPPVHIVEDGKTVPMIDGYPLVADKDYYDYIRKHKKVERTIMYGGFFAFVILLIITFPRNWDGWRDFDDLQQNWGFSVLEKMVGSVIRARS
jgi:hypothetical protein